MPRARETYETSNEPFLDAPVFDLKAQRKQVMGRAQFAYVCSVKHE